MDALVAQTAHRFVLVSGTEQLNIQDVSDAYGYVPQQPLHWRAATPGHIVPMREVATDANEGRTNCGRHGHRLRFQLLESLRQPSLPVTNRSIPRRWAAMMNRFA